jgi:hypothetical protein
MKIIAIAILAIFGGFLGGFAAIHFSNPTAVMAQGYAAPQIFVNGQELKPVANKINVVTLGTNLTTSVSDDGTLFITDMNPPKN